MQQNRSNDLILHKICHNTEKDQAESSAFNVLRTNIAVVSNDFKILHSKQIYIYPLN